MMRNKQLRLNAAILLSLVLSGLQAQDAIPATGGNASGSGGQASYTIGQVVYNTQTGTAGSVAQGVQQPFEISTVTGLEEAKGINLSVKVYPNPATEYLLLIVDELDLLNLSYQLFDMNGKILQHEKITGRETSIEMSNFVSAAYFLKVIQGNMEIKSFKIIKN
jgi:hypothetical protein